MRLVPSRWKTIGLAIVNYWRPSILNLFGIALAVFLLTFKLATIMPGFNESELAFRGQSTSLPIVRNNPLHLAQKSWDLLFQHFHHYGPLAMRSLNALIGLAVILSFFYVMSRWYTKRVAILTSLLFACSSWLLHSVRLATPEASFLLLFILFACGVALQQSHRNRIAPVAAAAVSALLLYVPGMVWFVIPAIIWQRRRIINTASILPIWQLIFVILAALGSLVPLVLAIVQQPSLYRAWLGLPEQWPSIIQVGKNLIHIPSQIFLRGPNDPAHWLGRLPLLDWFSTVMFIIGAYTYWYKLHLDRAWLLIYVALAGSLLVALAGPVSLALFIPFIYLVVASGVALMLQQWFTVFPRNPFARGLGLTFLTVAVLASCAYQLNHYYIAWPHNPEAKAAFQKQP